MPDTTVYLFLGLGVMLSVLALYVVSLIVRMRHAYKDIDVIQELLNE